MDCAFTVYLRKFHCTLYSMCATVWRGGWFETKGWIHPILQNTVASESSFCPTPGESPREPEPRLAVDHVASGDYWGQSTHQGTRETDATSYHLNHFRTLLVQISFATVLISFNFSNILASLHFYTKLSNILALLNF